MRSGSSPRSAFTLVELLVAAALIVFMMAVLSHVLVSATKTFRDLKGAGSEPARTERRKCGPRDSPYGRSSQ